MIPLPDPSPAPIQTLVVKRDEAASLSSGVVGVTPTFTSNVIFKALSPLKVVLIRSARVFVQSLSAGSTVATFTNMISFKTALTIAAATAAAAALQNTGELLAKLDQTMPELRG